MLITNFSSETQESQRVVERHIEKTERKVCQHN